MSYLSADDIHREIEWEVEGVRRGVERYRAAAAAKDASELSPGQSLMREIIPGLAKAITQSQEEAAHYTHGQRPQLWATPILMLDAERLAVIVMTTALRLDAYVHKDKLGTLNRTGGLTHTALAVSRCVRDQVEYDRWVEQQRAATKRAKAAGDTEHKDLLRALRLRFPTLSRSAWHRFRGRVEALREGPWKEGHSLALGAHLLHLLCAAAPTRFEIRKRWIMGNRTEFYLAMSDETRELLDDRHAWAEVARPMLLPMLIPPNPWRYAECTPSSAA